MKRWKNNAYRDEAMKIWLQVYFPSRYMKGNFVRIKNIRKEQLCKRKF